MPAVEDGCIRDTFLRFEVVGECFDGSSVLITLVGRFRHGTSFENIAGFLSNIMKYYCFLSGRLGNAHRCEHVVQTLNVLLETSRSRVSRLKLKLRKGR